MKRGMTSTRDDHKSSDRAERRSFLERSSSAVMAFGLVSGYGLFTALIGHFLFPSRRNERQWQFVSDLARIRAGESLSYESPAGERVVITRLAETGDGGDFIALSSVCPHLGCQVHWELQNERFFCPCHNGAFDASGRPTEGPPGDAGQALSRYPLKVENGLLFIEVAMQALIES